MAPGAPLSPGPPFAPGAPFASGKPVAPVDPGMPTPGAPDGPEMFNAMSETIRSECSFVVQGSGLTLSLLR